MQISFRISPVPYSNPAALGFIHFGKSDYFPYQQIRIAVGDGYISGTMTQDIRYMGLLRTDIQYRLTDEHRSVYLIRMRKTDTTLP